jgi:hypothetical protein
MFSIKKITAVLVLVGAAAALMLHLRKMPRLSSVKS